MKKTLLILTLLYPLAFFGCGEAYDVAREEVGPRALLKKYEWFKDVAAQLDKKQADIEVYESRLVSLEQMYKGVARKDWPRTDLEQSNIWRLEVAGIKASYNSLAAQYNANMSKINYAFTNVGDLPPGAVEPLPRSFREYVTQ